MQAQVDRNENSAATAFCAPIPLLSLKLTAPVTTTTTTANSAAKRNTHQAEKWEIDTIGGFLLALYHQQKIGQRSNWQVLKYQLRDEFRAFLAKAENIDLRHKLAAANGTIDIGTLLYRTRYLINTPRGCDFFRIKNIALFQYRNEKLAEFDEERRNGKIETNDDNVVDDENGEGGGGGGGTFVIDPALEAAFEVDDTSKSYPVEYRATEIQEKKSDFQLATFGCYICQRNFEQADEYETHVEYHGEESDFEWLASLDKDDSPALKLSYRACKKSHYYCFDLELKFEHIKIDKIIIMQSRSMFYVRYIRACPNENKLQFFVDSHLFSMQLEQPIVIVYHDINNRQMRIVEQHHFMCTVAFPLVNFAVKPCRLSTKRVFKKKFELPEYMPSQSMRVALEKNSELTDQLIRNMSNEFNNYLMLDKQLTKHNIRETLNILLQIEDMDILTAYHGLTQRKVKLHKFNEEYKLKLQFNNAIQNIINPYDVVIIIPETAKTLNENSNLDMLLKNVENIQERKRLKVHLGRIERISSGHVTFICDYKIPLEKFYMAIFRPARLTLRYQYRALELLGQMSVTALSRFLFPTNVQSTTLPSLNALKLQNETIASNPEQLCAVHAIAHDLHKDAPFIVFGPPGTGKTTTLVEAILQLYLYRPQTKILVTAGSNAAADELALRLCRVIAERDELNSIVRVYSRSNEKRSDNIDEQLLEHSNMHSAHFYPDVEMLHEYRIVVCTMSIVGKLLTGKFGKDAHNQSVYTHVFVDEAAASTESETLMAIVGVLSERTQLIISGDHKQLGPILQSTRAEEYGLGVSLMERLLALDCYKVAEDGSYNHAIQTRLRRNHRSHPEIVKLYNELYYDNELIAVANIESDCNLIKNWHHAPNPNYPIIFHSVFGNVERGRNSTSMYNTRELEVVMDYVKDLMYFGVNGEEITQQMIGIISPYKKQYMCIQEELNTRKWYDIETGSVETFQGKEKRIIIVSFVRSFTPNLGFLENPRRLNVTISRPKSLLILIGNPKTLSMNDDFRHIIHECHRNNSMVGSVYHELIHGVSIGNLAAGIRRNSYGSAHELSKLNASTPENGAGESKKKQKQRIYYNRIAAQNGEVKCIDSATKTAAATGALEKQQQQQKLAQPLKKHVPAVSQQKQRKNFEVYKNLMKSNATNLSAVATTSAMAAAAAANVAEVKKAPHSFNIDELFSQLPTVPELNANSNARRENIADELNQVNAQLAAMKLKMKMAAEEAAQQKAKDIERARRLDLADAEQKYQKTKAQVAPEWRNIEEKAEISHRKAAEKGAAKTKSKEVELERRKALAGAEAAFGRTAAEAVLARITAQQRTAAEAAKEKEAATRRAAMAAAEVIIATTSAAQRSMAPIQSTASVRPTTAATAAKSPVILKMPPSDYVVIATPRIRTIAQSENWRLPANAGNGSSNSNSNNAASASSTNANANARFPSIQQEQRYSNSNNWRGSGATNQFMPRPDRESTSSSKSKCIIA